MATGGIDDDTDLYTCQVCLEDQTKRSPRLLSCHHSFCQDCIKKLVKGGKVECPTCRKLTLIAEDDVAELSMNFMLMKMKEHVDKLLTNKQSLCQVCGFTVADKKCKVCSHLLCDTCCLKHVTQEPTKFHPVFEVCSEHLDRVITHVCFRCIKGACSVCLINEHADHKEKVVLYKEGVYKMRESMVQLRDALKKKLTPVIERKEQENETEQLQQFEKFELSLIRLHDILLAKSENVQEFIEKIQNHNKKIKDVKVHKEEAVKQLSKLEECVLEPDVFMVTHYSRFKEKSEKELKRDFNDYLLEQFLDGDICSDIAKKVNMLQVGEIFEPESSLCGNFDSYIWTQLIYETSDFDEISIVNPSRIQCLNPVKVIIFDTRSRTDAILDISFLPPKTKITDYERDLNDAVYHKGHIWSCQDGNIEQVELHSSENTDDYRANIKCAAKLFPGTSKKIIIYDNIMKRVYEYCRGQIKKVVTDIVVDHIAVLRENRTIKGYVVTNTFHSTLEFYNQNWVFQRVAKISGIKGPSEVISTPMGLLVANTGNNCVTLLDNQGELVEECVVGEKEGIRRPVSIDYMEPYLWMAECDKYEGHRSIKCFELRPNLAIRVI